MSSIVYKGDWWFPVRKEFILNPEFSVGAKALYCALKSYCAPEGTTAFPSGKTLAAALGVTPATLRKYGDELVSAGLLQKEQHQGEEGRFTNTIYTLFDAESAKNITRSTNETLLNKGNGETTGDAFTRSGKKPRRFSAAAAKLATNKDPIVDSNKDPLNNKRGAEAPASSPEEKVPEATEAADPTKLPPEAVWWNEHCGRLPKVSCWTDSRQRSLSARRKDAFWQSHFRGAVAIVTTSKFCLGENDRGWRADFSWMLQPDTVAKVVEGKYSGNQKSAANSQRAANLFVFNRNI